MRSLEEVLLLSGAEPGKDYTYSTLLQVSIPLMIRDLTADQPFITPFDL